MKEVLTKSFWRGVTKTFYEALESPPPKPNPPSAPAAPEAKKEEPDSTVNAAPTEK